MAERTSRERAADVVCVGCPIVYGTSVLVRWLIRRLPHAARAAALVAVALAGASLANALNPFGLPWLPSPGDRVGIPRAFEARLPQIDAKEAFRLYQTGDVLFVDSRDAGDYDRDHIPGAVNAPMRKWMEIAGDVESLLPRDTLLVLYCYGAHCGLSTRQGKALLEAGYEKLVVVDYGWATWTKHGYPTEKHQSAGAQ
jgi:rhodanese-related sulfurtransferase